jgi:ABC-type polysaccharide/polyol phosphate export permease
MIRTAVNHKGPVHKYLASVLFLARISLNSSFRLTFLGMLWSLLNPAVQICIYFFVFSAIIRFEMDNYLLYLISGILPWTFFSQTLTASADSLLTRAHILHHCLVSKTIFPVADMLSKLVVSVISLVVMYMVVALISGGWTWRFFLLPLAAAPLVVATASASIGISFVAARARDVSHLLGVLFAVLFWLTPIIYPLDAVPAQLAAVVALNPVHYLIWPIKLCLYGGENSLMVSVLQALGVSALITLAAYLVYLKLRTRIIFFI